MLGKLTEKIFNIGFMFQISQHYFPYIIGHTKGKNKYLIKKLSEKTYKKVLDFACGTGYISKLIPDEKYIGLDINKSYIEYARKKFPNKKFILAKPGELPFKKEEFDLILFLTAIHHIEDKELHQLMEKFKSILTKDGRMIIIDAPPVNQQTHPLVKFIMKNEVGGSLRTSKDLETLCSKYLKIEKNNTINFGKYRIIEIILKKNVK